MASPSCCTTGVLHEGTPQGTVETLHNLPTYRAEPSGSSPKAIIVMIPDAFGWDFVNLRLLADRYAERGGFTVLMPDFMDGTGVDPRIMGRMEVFTDKNESWFTRIPALLQSLFHFIPFMIHNRVGAAQPKIFAFFRALRAANPSTPIGSAGYCWGGKFVFSLSHQQAVSERLVDAGFTAHPSNLVIPADGDAVVAPVSVAQGTDDFVLQGEQMEQLKRILEDKEKCEVVMYEGAKHGFSVKGDEKDEKVRRQAREAEDQAIAFWKRHLLGE